MLCMLLCDSAGAVLSCCRPDMPELCCAVPCLSYQIAAPRTPVHGMPAAAGVCHRWGRWFCLLSLRSKPWHAVWLFSPCLQERVRAIFEAEGFACEYIGAASKLMENRKKGEQLDRRFVQVGALVGWDGSYAQQPWTLCRVRSGGMGRQLER